MRVLITPALLEFTDPGEGDLSRQGLRGGQGQARHSCKSVSNPQLLLLVYLYGFHSPRCPVLDPHAAAPAASRGRGGRTWAVRPERSSQEPRHHRWAPQASSSPAQARSGFTAPGPSRLLVPVGSGPRDGCGRRRERGRGWAPCSRLPPSSRSGAVEGPGLPESRAAAPSSLWPHPSSGPDPMSPPSPRLAGQQGHLKSDMAG